MARSYVYWMMLYIATEIVASGFGVGEAGAYTSVYRYAAPEREHRPTPPQSRV